MEKGKTAENKLTFALWIGLVCQKRNLVVGMHSRLVNHTENMLTSEWYYHA